MQCDMRHKHNAVPSRTGTYKVVHALPSASSYVHIPNVLKCQIYWFSLSSYSFPPLQGRVPSFDSVLVNSWLHKRRGETSGIDSANTSPHIFTHYHSDYHKKQYKRNYNDSHSSSHSSVYSLITYILWWTKDSSFHQCVVNALRPCPLTGWKNWISGKFQIWHNHFAATGSQKEYYVAHNIVYVCACPF